MSDNSSSNETQPPQRSADSLNVAAPTDDPIRKLVGEMSKIAGTLGPEQRELKERIGRLAALLEEPERVQQPGFRTGVAYALQDLQKVTHATSQMDSALAQEMKDRAVTSPGLSNPRVEALMQATPSIMDAELVRGIREIAASATRGGPNQDTPQLREEIDVLENRLRLAKAPRVDGTSHRLEATAQRITTGVTPDPSPRASTSPEESRRRRRTQPSAQHGKGTIPPQQSRGAVGDIMRSLRMPIPSGLEYQPAPPATAVGARISMFEQRLAQGRTDRLIQNAERSGVRAIEATEQFITGPGRRHPRQDGSRGQHRTRRHADRHEGNAAGRALCQPAHRVR